MTPENRESAEKLFLQKKVTYQQRPAQLKFIEAQERMFFSERPGISDEDILNVLQQGLENWEDNPIGIERLVISGFAKLINTVLHYESDTFSSSTRHVTEGEALLLANALVDRWSGQHLSGTLLEGLLDELRK